MILMEQDGTEKDSILLNNGQHKTTASPAQVHPKSIPKWFLKTKFYKLEIYSPIVQPTSLK